MLCSPHVGNINHDVGCMGVTQIIACAPQDVLFFYPWTAPYRTASQLTYPVGRIIFFMSLIAAYALRIPI